MDDIYDHYDHYDYNHNHDNDDHHHSIKANERKDSLRREGLQGQKLRTLVEGYGVVQTRAMLKELLKPDDKGVAQVRPEEISIRELWEAFIGPVSRTLEGAGDRLFATSRGIADRVAESEGSALMTAAFTDIVGVLLASKMIAGYNAPGYVGDLLFDTVPSKLRSERYAGYTSTERPLEVPEGQSYKETGFMGKYATSEALKKGRLLNITEEAIFFDRTGELLRRAMMLGEKARTEREQVMIDCFTDRGAAAGTFIFRPLGVGAALYRIAAAAPNLTVNQLAGNALVDWTDVDNAEQVFTGMVDENNDLILVLPRVLVVPSALKSVAKRIVGATELRSGPTTAIELTIWSNPYTGLVVISSPMFDTISATNWYLGDPKKQFVWQEVWPLQILRATLQEEKHLRDIVFSVKVRYFGGAAAIDDKYVVRSTP